MVKVLIVEDMDITREDIIGLIAVCQKWKNRIGVCFALPAGYYFDRY